MSSEINAYIEHFRSLHQQVRDIIFDMSEHELAWCPIEEETNSASVLMIHVLGAEKFRIHQIAGGMSVNRDRESEFLPNSVTLDDLLNYLDEVGCRTGKVLEGLSPSGLDKIVSAVRSYERDEPVRWHILHTIEHFGIHIGHLSLNRQLYLIRSDSAG